MHPFFEIRPYEPADQAGIRLMMDEIQKEFSQIFTAPDSKPIPEFIKEGGLVWVAVSKEKIAGTVALIPFDGKRAIIKRMFISNDFRGSKLAPGLLGTALNEARSKNFSEIYLGTMAQFKAAQQFYMKHGFQEVLKEELPNKMELSSLDTLFFRLYLTCDNNRHSS